MQDDGFKAPKLPELNFRRYPAERAVVAEKLVVPFLMRPKHPLVKQARLQTMMTLEQMELGGEMTAKFT